MRRLTMLMRVALIGALVMMTAIGGMTYVLLGRSLPDYRATHVVDGVRSEIEVLRDDRATPHVFAKSEQDVFFGLGFVHAQDRLWQMELRRRVAQGRVSELFGGWTERAGLTEMALRIDKTMRALDLQGASERSLAALSPSVRKSIDAYAAGVNAWLEIVDAEALGAGAPELLALGASLEPWRPEDSVAAFKLLAASLSATMMPELRRARFLIGLGPERTADLFPSAAGGALTALPPYATLFDGTFQNNAIAGSETAFSRLADLAPFPFASDPGRFGGASNAWAVAGARSATRAPLLASDPHLALTTPGIWYMARLEFGDGGVIGATVPGIPAVLIGRNEKIAWGMTTLYADVADVFIEKLNPENPQEYLTPNGWAPFETRRETIRIDEDVATEIEIRATRHGPVLPLDWPKIAQVTPSGHVAALSWTVLNDTDRSVEAAMRLMRAPSVAEATPLAEMVSAPPQNVIIADAGSIGFFSVGRAPLRNADHTTRGRAPAPGWLTENDWAGWMAPADLPRSIDPESGVVANANNRTTDSPFPRHLTFDWPEPYRIQRLEKVLNNREYHTLQSFRAMQNDTVSAMARAVLPLIAAPLWAVRETERGQRAEALERLARWNGDMDPFLAEPLIFSAWSRALVIRLTEDDLDEIGAEYPGPRPLFLERVFRDIDGAADRWCDDRRTLDREDCAMMASLALDDALAELTEAYGDDLASWRWGKAHEALHKHAPFGEAPWLGLLLNIRHETGGGDHTLLRGRMTGDGETPYRNVHAGGFRAIYDFADLNRSIFAISTGQSGHFLSRHYDDFADLWRSGEYAPLSLARTDAEAGSVGTMRLVPADAAGSAEE